MELAETYFLWEAGKAWGLKVRFDAQLNLFRWWAALSHFVVGFAPGCTHFVMVVSNVRQKKAPIWLMTGRGSCGCLRPGEVDLRNDQGLGPTSGFDPLRGRTAGWMGQGTESERDLGARAQGVQSSE